MLNPFVGSSPAIVMCVGENSPATGVKRLVGSGKNEVVYR